MYSAALGDLGIEAVTSVVINNQHGIFSRQGDKSLEVVCCFFCCCCFFLFVVFNVIDD